MKRETKYYVSIPVNNGGVKGLRRLTAYLNTEIEARNYFNSHLQFYDTIFLKCLLPNHTRKTLEKREA